MYFAWVRALASHSDYFYGLLSWKLSPRQRELVVHVPSSARIYCDCRWNGKVRVTVSELIKNNGDAIFLYLKIELPHGYSSFPLEWYLEDNSRGTQWLKNTFFWNQSN